MYRSAKARSNPVCKTLKQMTIILDNNFWNKYNFIIIKRKTKHKSA